MSDRISHAWGDFPYTVSMWDARSASRFVTVTGFCLAVAPATTFGQPSQQFIAFNGSVNSSDSLGTNTRLNSFNLVDPAGSRTVQSLQLDLDFDFLQSFVQGWAPPGEGGTGVAQIGVRLIDRNDQLVHYADAGSVSAFGLNHRDFFSSFSGGRVEENFTRSFDLNALIGSDVQNIVGGEIILGSYVNNTSPSVTSTGVASTDGLLTASFTTAVEASDNLVILTHGWQPDPFGTGSPDGLPEVRQAVESRLAAEGLLDKTEIIDFRWDEAVTPTFPALNQYMRASSKTYRVGNRLAEQVANFIDEERATGDPNYDPQIHFIGHSLGTEVNAEAVGRLHRRGDITVEQVTILDSPLSPGAGDDDPPPSLFDHSAYFYDKMPEGSVEYVDNYFGTDRISFDPAFGQVIAGTGPVSGGLRVEGADHSDVHADFYAGLVYGGQDYVPGFTSWDSPVFDDWQPRIRWNPNDAPATGGYLVQQIEDFDPDYEFVTDGVSGIGFFGDSESDDWVEMATQSPAILETKSGFLPDDLAYLAFTVVPVAPGDGLGDGVMTLFFNDIPLWEGEFSDIGSEDEILLRVGYFAGEVGSFTWQLDPLGDEQAIAYIGEFEYLRLVPVPEPTGAAIAAFGFAALLMRKQRH